MDVSANGAVDHAAGAVEEDGEQAAVDSLERGVPNRSSSAELQRRLQRGLWGMEGLLGCCLLPATEEDLRASRCE